MIQSIIKFFGFSESDEDDLTTSVIHTVSAKTPVVEALPSATNSPYEIRISTPKEYEDSINIATHLQKNRAVLVNIHYLDPSTSKRLIDFLCGTAYAMNGNMKKVTDTLFIFSPKHILIEMATDISDIEKAQQEYQGYKIDTIANA